MAEEKKLSEAFKAQVFRKGQSGNPAGRLKNIGLSVRAWCSIHQNKTPEQLKHIIDSRDNGSAEAGAALQLLRMRSSNPMSDYQDLIDGKITLRELQEKGVDTSAIKRFKRTRYTTKGGIVHSCEIQLHDWAGHAFDRVVNQTAGYPTEHIEIIDADASKAEERPDDVLLILRGEYPHLLPPPPDNDNDEPTPAPDTTERIPD